MTFQLSIVRTRADFFLCRVGYSRVLGDLLPRFPMTQKDVKGRTPPLPYKLVPAPWQFKALNMGRRKAIEVSHSIFTRAMFLTVSLYLLSGPAPKHSGTHMNKHSLRSLPDKPISFLSQRETCSAGLRTKAISYETTNLLYRSRRSPRKNQGKSQEWIAGVVFADWAWRYIPVRWRL